MLQPEKKYGLDNVTNAIQALPKRKDFANQYDEEFELWIADLEFFDDETPEDESFK